MTEEGTASLSTVRGTMELRHLQYFVAVAEELHFTRAAEVLHISQPPLSQAISQLETELGTELFHRTSRSVVLTEAGRTLLPEARRLLTQADDFRRVARGDCDRLAPPLRLASVSSGYSDLLPRLLPRFRERHPTVTLLLTWCDPADQIRDLLAGHIDVGLIRTSGEEIPGLSQAVIEVQPFIAAVPARHRLARRPEIRVADLAHEDLIILPRRCNPYYVDAIVEACRGADFSPAITYQPEDDQVLLGLVAAGLGIGIVPACVSNLTLPGVDYKSFAAPRPVTTLCWAEASAMPCRYFDDLCDLTDSRRSGMTGQA